MSAIALNDNEQLAFTQDVRRKIVAKLLPDGNVPDDPKLLSALLKTLEGHDKVTLTLKRIDADNEIADADRQALQQVHRLSQQLGSKDLARVDRPDNDSQVGPATPFNPEDIPRTELVEGELHQGGDAVDYDQFMQEQTVLHQQRLDNQG